MSENSAVIYGALEAAFEYPVLESIQLNQDKKSEKKGKLSKKYFG